MKYLKSKTDSVEESILQMWEKSAKQNEASGDKEAYQKFFNKALKKFGINSPAELKSDEEKKKFYDYIDKNWTADHEESVKKEARQLKDPKKEMMVSLKGKVKVINKSEWPEYKKKGYIQAEEVEENFDVGTPENTKAKLEATPGQSVDAWEEQLGTIQKKNSSMRERLAQIWDMDEGKNPFEKGKKKEEKTSKKTMTGEPVTKVEVDPKISDK